MKALVGVMSLIILLGAAFGAEPNTPEYLYQKALNLETAKADYQGAIPIYATIISNHEQNAGFTIKALYRQGVCYEKIGQAEQAEQCAQKLANQYADAVKTNAELAEWVGHYVKTDESATARQLIVGKLNTIIIPSMVFRQADIADVVKYLVQQSIAMDQNSPPGKQGVNIILNLRRLGQAYETAPAAPAKSGSTNFAPSEETSVAPPLGVGSIPTVTCSFRDIILMDAIKYITAITRLEYRVTNTAVVITPGDVGDVELITHTYKVLPPIAKIIIDNAGSGGGGSDKIELGDVKKFFLDAGVPFPEGASIVFKPSLNLLVVKNTANNLENVERIMNSMKNSLNVVPMQVKVQADHIEITDPDTTQRFQRQTPTAEELRCLPTTAFRRHSSLTAITQSGVSTEAKSVATSEGSQATNEIGAVLNCTPVIRPDRFTIDITMLWQSGALIRTNPPLIASMTLTQSLSIWDGHAVVLPVQYQLQTTDQFTKKVLLPNPHYVIISATLIDPAGKPVNPPKQRPEIPGRQGSSKP